MSDAPSYQQDMLRQWLINGPAQRTLYMTSPEFNNGIDTLAAVLPIFVDALAQHSIEQRTIRERLIEAENLTARPLLIRDPFWDERGKQHQARED